MGRHSRPLAAIGRLAFLNLDSSPFGSSASKRKVRQNTPEVSRGRQREERKKPPFPLCSDSFRAAHPYLDDIVSSERPAFPAASDPGHDDLRDSTSHCRTGSVIHIVRLNRERCLFTAAPNRPIARPVSTNDTPPLPDVFVKEEAEGET